MFLMGISQDAIGFDQQQIGAAGGTRSLPHTVSQASRAQSLQSQANRTNTFYSHNDYQRERILSICWGEL